MFCEVLLVHVRTSEVLIVQVHVGPHLERDDVQRREKRHSLDLRHMGPDELEIAVVENDCRQARNGFVKVQRRDDGAFICKREIGMSRKQFNLLGDLKRKGAIGG